LSAAPQDRNLSVTMTGLAVPAQRSLQEVPDVPQRGKRMSSMTARRMISGDALKYLKGLRFVIGRG